MDCVETAALGGASRNPTQMVAAADRLKSRLHAASAAGVSVNAIRRIGDVVGLQHRKPHRLVLLLRFGLALRPHLLDELPVASLLAWILVVGDAIYLTLQRYDDSQRTVGGWRH